MILRMMNMSKKKDPDSWKGRGEAYKNAKRSPKEKEKRKKVG